MLLMWSTLTTMDRYKLIMILFNAASLSTNHKHKKSHKNDSNSKFPAKAKKSDIKLKIFDKVFHIEIYFTASFFRSILPKFVKLEWARNEIRSLIFNSGCPRNEKSYKIIVFHFYLHFFFLPPLPKFFQFSSTSLKSPGIKRFPITLKSGCLHNKKSSVRVHNFVISTLFLQFCLRFS